MEAHELRSRGSHAKHSIPSPALKTISTAQARTKKSHYKPLPKEFRRHGFHYRQIAREGNAAIYEQRSTDCAEPSVCYEVLRIRRRQGFGIGGRWVPAAEVYPNSEAWGVNGFTFTEKDAAFAKLRELAKSRRSER